MRFKHLFAMLLFLTVSSSVTGVAAEWSTLVQPIGTRNDPFLLDPAVLNQGYDPGKGPWETATQVTSIKTTTQQFFVRFYNPTAPLNPSGQEGGWVMRASEVRGLTPEQVRDKFALPNVPTMMTLGLTNTGESLYTGLAGPIAGWGDGGGQQSQRLDGPYTTFFNGQAVPASVLAYPALASSSNGRATATYLMAHVPEPYSDMESVYDSLDILYNPAAASQFDAALSNIGPERFDNLFRVGYDATTLHNRAVEGRLDGGAGYAGGFWTVGTGSYGRHTEKGFDSGVAGVVGGYDRPWGGKGLYGLSIAWLRGRLGWNSGGRVDADFYRVAAYAALDDRPGFAQVMASAGAVCSHSSRGIVIGTWYQPSPHGPAVSPLSTVSRSASSSPGGWDADLTARGGTHVQSGDLTLVPTVEAGCLYQSIGAFSESGAGGLDLRVADISATTFHAAASLRLERPVRYGLRSRLSPYLEAGWRYRRRLDGKAISASLNGWPDTFTVNVDDGSSSLAALSLGTSLTVGAGPVLFFEAFDEGDLQYGTWGLRAGVAWGW